MGRLPNPKKLTSLEEDMLWMSIRYAIGRHSISCVVFPFEIYTGLFERIKLDELNMGMLSNEINRNIADILGTRPYHFTIDNSLMLSNKYEEPPLYLFYKFLSDYKIEDPITELEKYKKIIVKKNDNNEIVFETEINTGEYNSYISRMDYDDLSNWQILANIFDKSKYKYCETEYDGITEVKQYIDIYFEISNNNYVKRKFSLSDKVLSFNMFINDEYVKRDNLDKLEFKP